MAEYCKRCGRPYHPGCCTAHQPRCVVCMIEEAIEKKRRDSERHRAKNEAEKETGEVDPEADLSGDES